MRGADVARLARSHATSADRRQVRAIWAATWRRAGTPSTVIAAGKLIDRATSPGPSDKDSDPRNNSIKQATPRIALV